MKRVMLLLWLLLAALPVRAQDAPVPSTAQDTLSRALERVEWNPAWRGALLVVNPQGTRLVPQPAPVEPATETDFTTLRLLVPRYGRQLFAVHSVTAVAPTTMTVLNAHPGKPDPFAKLQRIQKMTLLMGTLTPEQWRLLGSEGGLGAGDLTEKQRPVFLSLLPTPFALHCGKMREGINIPQRDKNVTLTPEQRASVRLRVNQAAEIYLPHDTKNFLNYSDMPLFTLSDGTEVYTLKFQYPETNGSAFGVALRAEVPNRLKPGPIAFDAPAWNVRVSLADIHTVGDLIRRIAQRTEREMYTDGRVAKLPVWMRGIQARAGDLLQALCLCVTGTLRQVGPAYVLTDDLEGIGTRRARLTAWAEDAQAQQEAMQQAAKKAAAAFNPLQYLAFAPGDPFALTPEDQQKLTANKLERGGDREFRVPLSALPPAQQDILKAFQEHEHKDWTRDEVKIYLKNRVSYVVPNIGSVSEEDSIWADVDVPTPASLPSLPAKPAVLPASMTARALIVAPPLLPDAAKRMEQATLLAACVRRHGLNQLWVEIPDSKAGAEMLAEYVAAGKQHGLAVVAVLRLMQAGSGEKQTEDVQNKILDRNLLGETRSQYVQRFLSSEAEHKNPNFVYSEGWMRTGDWLCPSSEITRTILERRLQEIASVPGLKGIAFKDVAAPGYRDGRTRAALNGVFTCDDFGYSEAMRLTFLRQQGYDPVDLAVSTNLYLGADLNLPFFADSVQTLVYDEATLEAEPQGPPTVLAQWNQFRYRANSDLLAALYTFMQSKFPHLPLWIRPAGDGWWGAWDKPDPFPGKSQPYWNDNAAQAAQITSRPLLLNVPYWGSLQSETIPTGSQHFAFWVEGWLERRKPGWDGVTLDLSTLPLDQVVSVLDGLASAKNR
jgi:hypothetical protein